MVCRPLSRHHEMRSRDLETGVFALTHWLGALWWQCGTFSWDQLTPSVSVTQWPVAEIRSIARRLSEGLQSDKIPFQIQPFIAKISIRRSLTGLNPLPSVLTSNVSAPHIIVAHWYSPTSRHQPAHWKILGITLAEAERDAGRVIIC